MSKEGGARPGSRGKVLGGAVLLSAVLGLWWGLRDGVPPEAPAVHGEPAGTGRVVVTNTAAAGVARAEPRLPPPTGECGLSLRVVDWQGHPVEGALLGPETKPETAMPKARTDAQGRARIEPIACGSMAWVFIEAAPWPSHLERIDVEQLLSDEEVEYRLPRFVLVSGQVLDEGGAPLPHASLFSKANMGVDTDDEARFRIWVRARSLDEFGSAYREAAETDPDVAADLARRLETLSFHATATDNRREFVDIPLPRDPTVTEIQQDVVMHPERQVQVRCEGYGPSHCDDLSDLTCSAPGMLEGESCTYATEGSGEDMVVLDHKLCPCPEGEAVVRGAGVEVPVAPGDEAVVLAFTGASVTGTLRVDGEPARSKVDLVRALRTGLDHIGIAGTSRRRSTYSRSNDGSFVLDAVPEGPATLWCHADGAIDGRAMVAEIVVPASGTLDVGEVECRQGGGISGHLVDRETGDRIDAGHGGVMARRDGSGTVLRADAASEGGFAFDALPAGSWTLWPSNDPTATQVVEVEDGVETEGVVLPTGPGAVLPRTGLVLTWDEQSQEATVQVADVLPDTPAARAGLKAGDTLVRGWVDGLAMGFPPPESEPAFPDPDMAAWVVLRARGYDGPGLTFTVDRDGEEVPVAFDW